MCNVCSSASRLTGVKTSRWLLLWCLLLLLILLLLLSSCLTPRHGTSYCAIDHTSYTGVRAPPTDALCAARHSQQDRQLSARALYSLVSGCSRHGVAGLESNAAHLPIKPHLLLIWYFSSHFVRQKNLPLHIISLFHTHTHAHACRGLRSPRFKIPTTPNIILHLFYVKPYK